MSEVAPVRCINKYKIGCDPEFGLYDGATIDQHTFVPVTSVFPYFFTGYAFGADLNGRLAEFRAAPSRSTLHVVASLLATMRFMAKVAPESLSFSWKAGAKAGRDGLGGHIHFARLSPLRTLELMALDRLTACLLGLGILPKDEQFWRIEHTQYGRSNDYRIQYYGYEYRSMPSWLESPRQAFICLTLAKLAVYFPAAFADFNSHWSSPEKRSLLANLNGKAVSHDDDACLLDQLHPLWLANPLQDFKQAWGLPCTPFKKKVKSLLPCSIIPVAIQPTPEEIEEVRSSLIQNTPIQNRTSLLEPQAIPDGWRSLAYTQRGVTNMVELLWDKVSPSEVPFHIYCTNDFGRTGIGISEVLYRALKPGCFKEFRVATTKLFPHNSCKIIGRHDSSEMCLWLGSAFRHVSVFRKTRKLFALLGLPMASIGEASPQLLEEFKRRFIPKIPKEKSVVLLNATLF